MYLQLLKPFHADLESFASWRIIADRWRKR